jgi:hypothetical protein
MDAHETRATVSSLKLYFEDVGNWCLTRMVDRWICLYVCINLVADVVMNIKFLPNTTAASSYIPELLDEATCVSNRKDLYVVVAWPS